MSCEVAFDSRSFKGQGIGLDVETIKEDMRELEDLRDAWVKEGKQNQDEMNRRRQASPGQRGQEPAHQQPLVPGYPEL